MRGAVYKRGSTRTWHFDIDPDPLTGHRRQRTKGGYPTKKAAEQALAEAIGQWRAGRLPQRSTHTLSHFLQAEWLPAVKPRLRPSTWANYRTYTAAYVVPVLGQVKLQALTPVQLNHLYAHLLERGRRKTTSSGRAGLAPKTVRNVHVMLHRALHDAMRWGYLVRNVAEAADPPAARTPEQKVWSPQELGTFLDHVRHDRLYALWLLVATTGMRRGELAGLRWVDIDFEHATVSPLIPRVVVDHQVHDSAPKTERARRRLALDPVTLAALQAQRQLQAEDRAAVGGRYRDHGYVFTWPDGRPLHPENIANWFEQHTRAAGLPRIRLHDVRHSYATAALKAGISARVISERLGHAIRQLAAAHGLASSGPLVRTGGGGWHFYLAPTGLGNVHPRGLDHVDWRGRGGYVVAPPSRHASGHPYHWVAAGRDLDTPPGPVPSVLLERLQPRQLQRPTGPDQLPTAADGSGERYARAALVQKLARVAAAPVGQRNRQLWESTRNLYNLVATGALIEREVHQGLLAAADRCGLLAEEPCQTRRTLTSGRQVGLAHPGRPAYPISPERTHAPAAVAADGRRTSKGEGVKAMAAAGDLAG
jgi:integrase